MDVRLQEKYKKEIVGILKNKFNYKNDFEIPKLEKVVLNKMRLSSAFFWPKFETKLSGITPQAKSIKSFGSIFSNKG